MVSDLMPAKLRIAKTLSPPSVEDLTREIGYLRHELQFYRVCFDSASEMRDAIYQVSLKMMDSFYFYAEGTIKQNERGRNLAFDIQDALEKFKSAVIMAEQDWMSFWGIPTLNSLDKPQGLVLI